MDHDVFLCHAAENREVVDALCDALEGRGVSCWMAPRDIDPGLPYATSIMEAIASTRLFVLIFSGFANRSPHVSRELERAVNLKVPIVPVLIEDTPPSDEIGYYISSTQWLVAYPPPIEPHLPEILATIDRGLGRSDDHRRSSDLVRPLAGGPMSDGALHQGGGLGLDEASTDDQSHQADGNAKRKLLLGAILIAAVIAAGLVLAVLLLAPGTDDTHIGAGGTSTTLRQPKPRAPVASRCNEEGTVRSQPSTQPSILSFVNRTNHALHIYWLDTAGSRVRYDDLPADQEIEYQTYIGHVWLLADASDRCVRIVTSDASKGTAVIDG